MRWRHFGLVRVIFRARNVKKKRRDERIHHEWDGAVDIFIGMMH